MVVLPPAFKSSLPCQGGCQEISSSIHFLMCNLYALWAVEMFTIFESPIPLIGNYQWSTQRLIYQIIHCEVIYKSIKIIKRHKKREIVNGEREGARGNIGVGE